MNYWVAAADRKVSDLRAVHDILIPRGFRVDTFWSGTELLKFLGSNRPDLIILDRRMIDMDGFDAMNRIRMIPGCRDISIIITDDDNMKNESEALSAGAADFVGKPFDESILLFRVGNIIELKRLQSDLKSEVMRMTSEIVREHEKNEKLSLQIVQTLAGTIDAKDSYTNGHSVRVAEYSRRIARIAGYSERDAEDIYMMGLLHDVGKIGIPDTVINKPSRLTDEEYDIIKTHPIVGYNILKNITEMPKLAIGARWHHERYDGKGYPEGMAGNDIPEEARIIAVADAYDAMSSRRSYRDVLDQHFIRSEFVKGSGVQFDPKFADIMIGMIDADKNYTMREHNGGEIAVSSKAVSGEKKPENFDILEKNGINTSAGMRSCMNDTGFYSQMLREFHAASQERVKNLTEDLNLQNWKKYRVDIHSLKSLSGILGAEKLCELSSRLEEAVRRRDTDYVAQNHVMMITELERITEAIGVTDVISG